MALVDKVAGRAHRRMLEPNGHHLRTGQAIINALYEMDPACYSAITGTTSDCFYDDDKIDVAYEFIAEWEAYQQVKADIEDVEGQRTE